MQVEYKHPSLSWVITVIVRIEFSPVVEIGVSNGHNLLQETTYEGLALSYTWMYQNQYYYLTLVKLLNWLQPILLNETKLVDIASLF